MNDLFEPAVALEQFKLPQQDIALLTFCSSNKAPKVSSWISELRLTAVRPTSVALYEALPEVTHLKTDVRNRFEILETFWPVVLQCCQSLAKDFLQQPLILPPNAQKTALLAQALQKNLLDGYCVCIRELTALKKLKPAQQEMLVHCLFKACVCINAIFFRCYQLYSQAPNRMWQQLHNLYQIAEYYELLNARVPAEYFKDFPARSVREAYIHTLALASLRPNQLSQNDIAVVHKALAGCIKQITLDNSETHNGYPLLLVNLSSDSGPANKNRFYCDQYDRVLELNVEAALNSLSRQPDSKDDLPLKSEGQGAALSQSLQVHVTQCWRHASERTNERQRADLDAEACVGLIDCHQQIAGNVTFEQFLNPSEGDDDNSLLSGNFNSLINSMTKKKDIDEAKPARQTIAGVTIQNISPGGYCLLWKGIPGNRVEAGELICVRERGRRSWNLGVVRWIRKLKSGSQLGVQLLTTQPVPYAAAFMYDMGGYSDYMRAIHIPAPAMDDQPPSIVTATAPFQEQSRVRLKQDDTELDVRFNRSVLSTSKVKLFSFDTLSGDA